jgi:hypothetical protein
MAPTGPKLAANLPKKDYRIAESERLHKDARTQSQLVTAVFRSSRDRLLHTVTYGRVKMAAM